MKSWQAALAHIAVSSIQAAAAVSFFNPQTLGGALANTQIQTGSQVALTLLQIWLANKNSKTDPNGKPLVETLSGNFVTGPEPLRVKSAEAGQ